MRPRCRESKYRGTQCLTLLAHWAHEVPNSPPRERLLAHIREDPALAERTKLALLEPLSQLYGNGASVAPGGVLEAANQASSQFARYYHHSAPFDREVLADLWNRCETDSGLPRRCRRARARAERTLGKL